MLVTGSHVHRSSFRVKAERSYPAGMGTSSGGSRTRS
jgi:hypothetical protein